MQKEKNTSETQSLCEQGPDDKSESLLSKSGAALCLLIKSFKEKKVENQSVKNVNKTN